MGCPVGELQQRMTSREFGEWVARARIKAEEAEQAEIVARVDSRMRTR
jgi:hypothetical protein